MKSTVYASAAQLRSIADVIEGHKGDTTSAHSLELTTDVTTGGDMEGAAAIIECGRKGTYRVNRRGEIFNRPDWKKVE